MSDCIVIRVTLVLLGVFFFTDFQFAVKSSSVTDVKQIWHRGYKTFFMRNSAEHEIRPANKSQITNHCNFFSCQTKPSMKISLLINMKMLTIVGIFISVSREN